MDLNKLFQLFSKLTDKGVIGKVLPVNKTAGSLSKRAKIAAILVAAAGLLTAISQYLVQG